ncbi:hypothetical protein [Candidatus Electronema sp. PJ]|uniref:hypothetical protein n=1 Tax=Candidatus Electronema sp. PJ TaxID=3401572 RepID=UPI003AA8509C
MFLIFFVLYALVSCKGSDEKHTNKKIQSFSSKRSTIQVDESVYAIEKRDVLGDIKLSLDIRLKNKISEKQLRQLALALKGKEHNKYERIFIFWYLPGMEIDAGAWATTHFKPNLEVRILGVTIEEEKELTASDEKRKGFVIGKWFDNSIIGGKYTLMNNNGTITMYIDFADGSNLEEEMIESSQSNLLRYDDKDENDHREYYIINSNGELAVYGRSGLSRTLQILQ